MAEEIIQLVRNLVSSQQKHKDQVSEKVGMFSYVISVLIDSEVVKNNNPKFLVPTKRYFITWN